MDKRTVRRTAVELVKDALILLLACSAVWMLSAGGFWSTLRDAEGDALLLGSQSDLTDAAEGAIPTRITATLRNRGTPERCTVQYDDEGVTALFRRTAGLLTEALSGAGEPQRITAEEWQRALQQAPGICFDFQGELPLSVLSGWLGVECPLPEVTVRRVLLTVRNGAVALYYHDADTGLRYRSGTDVVSAAQLDSALEGLEENGAYYAFESAETAAMDGDTVLVPNPEPMPVCTAENPVSAVRASLEELMADLNLNLSGSVFYSAAGEEVARIGSDTLRLSASGVLEYEAGEGEARFSAAGEEEPFAAAEVCRRLLQTLTAERCGSARFYLSRVEQTANGWQFAFSCCVNGVPVRLSGGDAALFSVENDSVTAFTIRLRRYAPGEETQLVLPPVQAAAAMDALSLAGRELQLTYRDTGENTVLPCWAAVEAG